MTCRIALFLLSVISLGAAEIGGLWTGQSPGRRGEAEDISFQFKLNGSVLTGKLFGDEFDLPLEEGTVSGDAISFIVTTTNYYSGDKVRFRFSGKLTGTGIELTRERIVPPSEKRPSDKKPDERPKPFTLKRLTG